jgi:hypothetical protein
MKQTKLVVVAAMIYWVQECSSALRGLIIPQQPQEVEGNDGSILERSWRAPRHYVNCPGQLFSLGGKPYSALLRFRLLYNCSYNSCNFFINSGYQTSGSFLCFSKLLCEWGMITHRFDVGTKWIGTQTIPTWCLLTCTKCPIHVGYRCHYIFVVVLVLFLFFETGSQ